MQKFVFYILLLINLLNWNKAYSKETILIDSLQSELKVASNDTSKANIYYALSKAYWYSNPQKSLYFAEQTLTISEKARYKKGIGNAYNSMGAIAYFRGDFPLAKEYHHKALEIRKQINDKEGIAGSNNNIGNVYYDQHLLSEALKHYIASKKIWEQIGDKKRIAESHLTIGNIYMAQSNYDEALKNYLVSLDLNLAINEEIGTAFCYGSIGNIYTKTFNYPEALRNLQAALKIFEKLNQKVEIASTHVNIGLIYFQQEKYNEALSKYLEGLKIYTEIGDQDNIAGIYNRMGSVYIKLNKPDLANRYLNDALNLAKAQGNLEHIKTSYANFAILDSSLGNYKQALLHHKLFFSYHDSLTNIYKENTRNIVQQQMQYDFDEKEKLTEAANKEKDARAKLRTTILIVGFLAMLIFALIFLGQRNKTAKEKKKSDELLLNILPEEVADELKQTGFSKAKNFSSVSVMFTDFKDFTKVSEKISPEDLVFELHTCFSAFDTIIQKYKIEKIKTIGDAYMCVGGMPIANQTHPSDMVNAAIEIMDFVKKRREERKKKGEFNFEIRIGISTGPVVAGIVGIKKFAYDIWGDTVNVASRMEGNSEPGKINISESTYELVKENFVCEHRGKIQVKNKGEIEMYFVEEKI